MRDAIIRELLVAWALERRELLRFTLPPCPVCDTQHWPNEECEMGPPFPFQAADLVREVS